MRVSRLLRSIFDATFWRATFGSPMTIVVQLFGVFKPAFIKIFNLPRLVTLFFASRLVAAKKEMVACAEELKVLKHGKMTRQKIVKHKHNLKILRSCADRLKEFEASEMFRIRLFIAENREIERQTSRRINSLNWPERFLALTSHHQ